MIPKISFFVQGFPKPAGSKRPFFNKVSGKAWVVDDCKDSKDWKSDVKAAAMRCYSRPLLTVPLKVRFNFQVLRPKGHYGSGKNSGTIKASAPIWPAVKPDVLKLARGVEDALSGIIWQDDALIVHETITKSYGDLPGVWIEISEMVL